MFMVVLSHYYCQSGFPDDGIFSFNELIMLFLASGGKIAVDIFVIISGYFLVNQKFSWRKILKFFSCTYFWSIAVLLFATTTFGFSSISPALLKKSLIPLTPVNWFARAYLHLYLIFPLLNKLLFKYDRKIIRYIIGLLTAIFFVIPTIKNIALGGYLSSLFMFANFYLIGAYIRLYSNESLEKASIYGGFLGIFIIYASTIFFIITDGSKETIMSYSSSGANLFVLMVAIGMFVFFKNINIRYRPIINGVAATTFAVYLIHDNDLIKNWLWHDVVGSVGYYHSPYLILHMLLSAICIFAVCSLLDFLRIRFIEPYIMALANKHDCQHK